MEYFKNKFSSFGGLNHADIDFQNSDVMIIGIPYDSGTSGKKGTSFAPETLRLLSKDMQTISRRMISIKKLKIKDMGDVLVHPLNDSENFNAIRSAYKSIIAKSDLPFISIGGDHSVTFPEIMALAEHEKIGLVWIDAHRDLLDEMMYSKLSHGSSLRRIVENCAVDPKNILLIGTRYMEETETMFLEENHISEVKQFEIDDSKDPRNLIKSSIEKISQNVDSMFLSIDIDGIDPGFAPGTGTPVAGGLTPNIVFNIIHDFPVRIRAADIVEVSPLLDHNNITSKLQLHLVTELCAKFVTQKKN